MKEFRAVIENTSFWSELSIIALSKDEAEKIVERFLQSDAWQKSEAEQQEMGIADPQYHCSSIEEYGDAPYSKPEVALLKSGGNG